MGYWHRPPKNEYQSGSSRTIKVQAERPEALKHSSSVLYVIPQNQWRPGGAKVSPFPYMDLPELAPPLRSPQHSAAASIVHHFHILSHCEWPKGTKSVNSKFIVSYVFFKKSSLNHSVWANQRAVMRAWQWQNTPLPSVWMCICQCGCCIIISDGCVGEYSDGANCRSCSPWQAETQTNTSRQTVDMWSQAQLWRCTQKNVKINK